MSAVITVQGLTKSFGARRVLDDISFAVDETDRIGFVGVNGSGKSTLLRIIATSRGASDERDDLDAGLITLRRDLRVEYVAQEPLVDLGLDVAQALRVGLSKRREPAQADEREFEVRALAAALGLARPAQRVSELSLGERRRVALGAALLARPDVLALDEPTNHLDADTVSWLEEELLAQRGALLLVTHDRYFLDRVATRILELDRGHLYAYDGGYSAFLEKQAERLQNASERERVRRAFVRRELEWIRRGPKARTTKQQARIDRFDVAVAAGAKAAELTPEERAITLQLPPGPRLGKTILDVRGLTKRAGERVLFRDLELTMKAGERIGIVGPNGAGKTTLVRTLLGLSTPDAGEIVVGQNTRFAYLDQGRDELDDAKTVLAEVAGGDGDRVFLASGPVHVRTFLRMFLFDDRVADTPVGKLSGGERNRVQLARLLRRGGNVLVLDEPTNDLDLITLGVLEAALCDFPGCALVVSHDRWFLDRVATAILAFGPDGAVQLYEGNYSSTQAKWAQPRAHLAGTAAPATTHDALAEAASQPPAAEAPKRPKKLSYKDQRELDGMEAAIERAEARVAELEATLSAPDLYVTGGAEVPTLVAELETARAEVERLYARWQALEIARG